MPTGIEFETNVARTATTKRARKAMRPDVLSGIADSSWSAKWFYPASPEPYRQQSRRPLARCTN